MVGFLAAPLDCCTSSNSMPTVVVMVNLAASPYMVQKHNDGRYLDIIVVVIDYPMIIGLTP